MTTVRLKGAPARNWFAEQCVKEYGPDGARERSCGPMLEAVEQVIADMERTTNGAADNGNGSSDAQP